MAEITRATGTRGGQEASEVSPTAMADTVIVAAALLETLALLGGLYWAATSDAAVSMAVRISVVVAVAVLGGAGVALAVVKRIKAAN